MNNNKKRKKATLNEVMFYKKKILNYLCYSLSLV